VGIIGRLDEPNRAALERMNQAMTHRGPDAGGTWVSTPDDRGWGALLGHRRLSILDLSEAGAQPMVDPLSGHLIVGNGDIYNFSELRQRLVAERQVFRSRLIGQSRTKRTIMAAEVNRATKSWFLP
jgi:asparagine synthase (glutamine-hydrolysing)